MVKNVSPGLGVYTDTSRLWVSLLPQPSPNVLNIYRVVPKFGSRVKGNLDPDDRDMT